MVAARLSSLLLLVLLALSAPLLALGSTPEGKQWLAENAEQDGVVVLPSGLQYRVLESGSGESPGYDNPCVCHYRSV